MSANGERAPRWQECAGYDALVGDALRRLGRGKAGDPMAVRLLAGGLSGSAVYRLEHAGEDVVLKVTLPGRDPRRLERARREALFYRELAGRVPLMVPRLLAVDIDKADGIALLLAASEPSAPPDCWTERDFAEVALQLGRFHATFSGTAVELGMPSWIRDKPRVTVADCRQAARQWEALHERDEVQEALKPYRSRLRLLLRSIPILEPRAASLPVTLCHGDCHAGNLLRGPAGEWIWADWQDVRLGPGVDDLSFLWTRAFAATDSPPPYDVIVRAYRDGLEAAGEPVDGEELEHALAWAELRSWAVDWPPYLGYLPAARVERVLERIGLLAEQTWVARRT